MVVQLGFGPPVGGVDEAAVGEVLGEVRVGLAGVDHRDVQAFARGAGIEAAQDVVAGREHRVAAVFVFARVDDRAGACVGLEAARREAAARAALGDLLTGRVLVRDGLHSRGEADRGRAIARGRYLPRLGNKSSWPATKAALAQLLSSRARGVGLSARLDGLPTQYPSRVAGRGGLRLPLGEGVGADAVRRPEVHRLDDRRRLDGPPLRLALHAQWTLGAGAGAGAGSRRACREQRRNDRRDPVAVGSRKAALAAVRRSDAALRVVDGDRGDRHGDHWRAGTSSLSFPTSPRRASSARPSRAAGSACRPPGRPRCCKSCFTGEERERCRATFAPCSMPTNRITASGSRCVRGADSSWAFPTSITRSRQ